MFFKIAYLQLFLSLMLRNLKAQQILAECEDITKFQTFVASYESCSKYIYCDGEMSFEGQCLGDNYFNEEAGNCDDPDKVICKSNGHSEINMQNVIDVISNTDGALVVNQASTSSPLENAFVTPMSAISTQYATPSLSSVLRPSLCLQIYGYYRRGVLPNFNSCTSYYFCYNGLTVAMMCPNGMYFNAPSGKCELQQYAQCANVSKIIKFLVIK